MIQLVLKLTNIGGFGRLMIPSNMSISRGLTRSLNMIYSNYLYFFFSFCYVLTCPPFFNYLFQTSLSFSLSLSLSNFFGRILLYIWFQIHSSLTLARCTSSNNYKLPWVTSQLSAPKLLMNIEH